MEANKNEVAPYDADIRADIIAGVVEYQSSSLQA